MPVHVETDFDLYSRSGLLSIFLSSRSIRGASQRDAMHALVVIDSIIKLRIVQCFKIIRSCWFGDLLNGSCSLPTSPDGKLNSCVTKPNLQSDQNPFGLHETRFLNKIKFCSTTASPGWCLAKQSLFSAQPCTK